jgi:hypothetical protein
MNGVAKVSVGICNHYIFKRPVATSLFVRFVDYWKGAPLPGALLLFGAPERQQEGCRSIVRG